MPSMASWSGMNKGKHRDIISEGEWVDIEPKQVEKLDRALEDTLDGIDLQVAYDQEFSGSNVTDKAWKEALKKAKESDS